MKSLTQTKLIIYLVAIFVAGGVSGGFFGYSFRSERRPPFRGPPSSEQMIGFIREKLINEIGIDDEQWKEIGPIITNSVREIGDLDATNRKCVSDLIDKSDARIMEKLTPEQKPRMQKMIEDRKQHRHGPPHKGSEEKRERKTP